ncbi:uncharacterized protein LOC105686611 isoform X5 [Athalia rosae]|nr:uncharacterized protein LOC105686611 isoform X5 [Athalia rosae]
MQASRGPYRNSSIFRVPPHPDRPAKSGGKARAATRRTDRLSCSPISEGPRRSVTEYTPDTERRTFCIVVHIHDTWAEIDTHHLTSSVCPM